MTEAEMLRQRLDKLREPFAPDNIAHLPKVWCKACRDANTKVCPSHRKQTCKDCKNNITTAHTDLDYVGHAEVTNRLLEVDCEWTWEPLAVDEDGLPKFDQYRGLWMRLTICGVSRIGYGSAAWPGYKDPGDIIKEIIGDGLRNAAQRFGVGLDMWAKTDLRADRAQLVADTLTEAFETPMAVPMADEKPTTRYLDAPGRERLQLLAQRVGLKAQVETMYVVSILLGKPVDSPALIEAEDAAALLMELDVLGDTPNGPEKLAARLEECAQPNTDEALFKALWAKVATADSAAVLRAVVDDARDNLRRFKLDWKRYRALVVAAQSRLDNLKVPA